MRAVDEPLRNLLIDLMGVANIEASFQNLVDTCALAVAGKGDDDAGALVAWLQIEAMEDFSKSDALRGKDLAPLADLLAARLEKRIKEIEAGQVGRA
ncbi:hypothetical protein [Methylocystis sp.]|uniref:hypothetical protein n=1 Tax=Methylocystis sp. TaxID=1911079 RepID=UPI003DA313E0